jgi:hypothetical protein
MMKNIKTNKQVKFLLVLGMFLSSYQFLFSQITGPTGIFLNTYNSYSHPAPISNGSIDQYYSSWTCTSPNVIMSPSGNNVTINVNSSETNCTITLSCIQYQKALGESYYSPLPLSLQITLFPSIILPTIYPGNNTVKVQDNCNNVGCNYLWNVSPSNLCPTCAATGLITQDIYVDPNAIPDYINVNCTVSGCSIGLSQLALEGVSQLIMLKDPVITGPQSIGCVGAPPVTNFQYTASSQLGASYYVWSWPSFITVISGQGTSVLTVVENAVGSGVITCKSYNGAGGHVSSNQINYPIQVCCRSQMSIVNQITSTNIDNQQAAISIDASNIIDNGASARYHAGGEVKLSTGFSATPGSYFHGYIENCTGVFNRMSNTDNTNNNGNGNNVAVSKQDEIINNILPTELKNIDLYPNPNNGEFKLSLNKNEGLPKSIIIRDAQGIEIKSIQNPTQYDYDFNLTDLSDGLYIINAFYKDKVVSKRFIKN